MRSLRMTVRGLMIVIALTALSIGAVYHIMDSPTGLKAEIRRRQAVLDSIDISIKYEKELTENIESYVAEIEARSPFDPRLDAWARNLSYKREVVARLEGIRSRAAGLVWRPWKRFKDARLERYEPFYEDPNCGSISRRSFEGEFRLWSLEVAAVAGFAVSLPAVVAVGMARRFRRPRPMDHGRSPPAATG